MTRCLLLLLACALCACTDEPPRRAAAHDSRWDGVEVATDMTYISRRLLGLPPVPQSYRAADPNIISDARISANVDAIGLRLDVDRNGAVDVGTDVVYVSRYMLGLPPVPASYRVLDPSIPADDVIAATIHAICAD